MTTRKRKKLDDLKAQYPDLWEKAQRRYQSASAQHKYFRALVQMREAEQAEAEESAKVGMSQADQTLKDRFYQVVLQGLASGQLCFAVWDENEQQFRTDADLSLFLDRFGGDLRVRVNGRNVDGGALLKRKLGRVRAALKRYGKVRTT